MSQQEIMDIKNSHETNELEISESFKNGVHLALLRLNQVLDSYSQRNGAELARNFELYINSMMQIVDWDGAFLYGILKVLGTVKTFIDSDKTPEEIVKEINLMFRDEKVTKFFNKDLSDEEINIRHRLIKALSLQFHPESPNVRSLDEKEIKYRTDIFKTRISPAIQEDGRNGLELLRGLISEFDINIEEY